MSGTANEDEKAIAGEINTNSIRALYVELFFNSQYISSATGFFIDSEKGPIFITNRHVVTGRHQDTGKPLDEKNSALPNNLRFKIIGMHEPVWYILDLFKDEDMQEPVWTEHPDFSDKVDLVGILIPELNTTIHHFVDTGEDWHNWEIADRVHVIGFPFGINDSFGIWATGYIASEPAVDHNSLPCFLIDCRTRKGQSGSIVIARFKKGDTVYHKEKKYEARREMTHFLGVYSGRVNEESDLGIVWRMDAVRQIKEHIVSSSNPYVPTMESRRFNRRSQG